MADKLIKICIIAPTIPPEYGGGGRRMYNQAIYIAGLGHKVTIVTNTPNANPQINNLSIELIGLPTWYKNKNKDKHLIRVFKRIIFQPIIIFQLFKVLSRKRFDVVHLVNSVTRLSLYAVLISKLNRLKIVNSTTLFGSDDPETIYRIRGKIFFYVFFRLTNAIVNNSPLLAGKCIESNIPAFKTHFIPNPVDTDLFKPPKSQKEKQLLKVKHKLAHFKCVLLTASIITPRKNIDVLINVFKKVHEAENNVCLLIAGPCSQEKQGLNYYDNLKKLVFQLGLNENVFFLGHSDVAHELMKASDIFVFASEREGCPNVVLEALSSGMPVVMKKIDKVSDYIFSNLTGFVVRSENEFSHRLLELINDSQQIQEMSKMARKRAVHKFANKPVIEKYIELYHSVAFS